jgi:regulator of replication initiation timing
LEVAKKQLTEWDKELNHLHERNGDLGLEVQNLKEELGKERADREKNKKSAPARKDFPDAADLLNQLKTRRRKSSATLADVETLLELLEN